jgi:hypothetical protein
MIAISKLRIAKGVGVAVFVALLLFGITVSPPAADASTREWIRVVAKSLVVAAIGSTAIIAFLAVWVADIWVWVSTWRAFDQVPRWNYGWVLNPEVLSDEGKSARLWLFRVYGSLALLGLLMYSLQRFNLL